MKGQLLADLLASPAVAYLKYIEYNRINIICLPATAIPTHPGIEYDFAFCTK
jgi:hypothetical protein